MAQESTTASSPQKPSLEPSTGPVRIGLLVNSATVAKYDAEFIAWTETQPDIEVTHLILHAPSLKRLPTPAIGALCLIGQKYY